MNPNIYHYRFQTIIAEANNILIIIKSNPDIDQIASALSLYLSLIQKGKQITIACPDKMTVSQSNLFAVDKITDDLDSNGNNLTISFPYVEGSIEKVSYNIENNRFNLVIEPREQVNLNRETIEFSQNADAGKNADLIITIGVASSVDLGKFETITQELVQNKKVVVVSNTAPNLTFGFLKIVNIQNRSLSEVITLLLQKINLPFDGDIARNLLTGIKSKTNNFSNGLADSFEAAAICMRKINPVKQDLIKQPVQSQPFQKAVKPVEVTSKPVKTTPPDWLKPKIYRSSSATQVDDNQDKGRII